MILHWHVNEFSGYQVLLEMLCLIWQVLLEDLRAHSSGRQSHCSSSDLVVACCHAILTSRCLNEIFTNRFEVMVRSMIKYLVKVKPFWHPL